MLLHRIHDESEEPEAKDNIIAAFCRIVEFQFLPLPESQRPAEFESLTDAVFAKIPFNGDVNENETILKFAMKLFEVDQARAIKYMPTIAKTSVMVICDERCRDEIPLAFRKQLGQFVRQVVSQHA